MLSHGPIIFAIILWRNSLVFHSVDKVTSVMIHIFPCLQMYNSRWHFKREVSSWAYIYAVFFYWVWQLLYLKYAMKKDKVTSYSWLISSDTIIAKICQKFNDTLQGYISLQFIYSLISMLFALPSSIWQEFDALYIQVMFTISVFNGAKFYIEIFSERYARQFKNE